MRGMVGVYGIAFSMIGIEAKNIYKDYWEVLKAHISSGSLIL